MPSDSTTEWLAKLIDFSLSYPSVEDLMRISFQLACASVDQGGGPFGAIIADGRNRVISAGCNSVISDSDSTAHAEINCLRDALRKLKVTDLSQAPHGPYTLLTSSAPCIQCYGAIYWSGLAKVYAGARKEEVELLGFDEGPVTPELWADAHKRTGVVYVPDFCHEDGALVPLEAYRKRGGQIY